MHQTEHPCAECPWSRQTRPGLLGGAAPDVYVGQIVLPFWLPCHQARAYDGKQSDVNAVHQCAGAAIMRSHLAVEVPEPLLTLPPDRTRVFATLAEFVAHHTGVTLAVIERWLTPERLRALAAREWADPRVQLQWKQRDG
jgi:hypothetical protein